MINGNLPLCKLGLGFLQLRPQLLRFFTLFQQDLQQVRAAQLAQFFIRHSPVFPSMQMNRSTHIIQRKQDFARDTYR